MLDEFPAIPPSAMNNPETYEKIITAWRGIYDSILAQTPRPAGIKPNTFEEAIWLRSLQAPMTRRLRQWYWENQGRPRSATIAR